MDWGKLRQGPVVGLAGVVLGVLIAQIAVAGGSDDAKIASLRHQVDELSSKVNPPAQTARTKKRGPRGPQGPAGPQGLPGAAGPTGLTGPTAGAAKGLPGDPAAAEFFAGSSLAQTIAAPVPGRLFAMFTTSGTNFFVSCTAGNPNLGLYVDEVPVPQTQRTMVSGAGEAVDVFGVTAPLPAGDHLVQIGAECPSGNVMSISQNEASVGGFLLGS